MSGGFFRGTSADQDTRFSNKQAKLMKSQKFAPELEHLVEMSKVNMDVLRPWIATRVTEFLGFEDEVLINFIYGLLDVKVANGKEIQISLTGFMEKNTVKFMRELWTHLLSAQNNASGVPQQFLDEKQEATRKKQEEADAIETQRKKEMLDLERSKKIEEGVEKKSSNGAGPNSSRDLPRGSNDRADVERGTTNRHSVKGRDRVLGSPLDSADSDSDSLLSPRPGKRDNRSSSASDSPKARGRSISSKRRRRDQSPQGRPIASRRRSPGGSLSPRRSPHPRRGSRSNSPDRSRSPVSYRVRSPYRRRTRSPGRRRSPPPFRNRRSPSPFRGRRSPYRRRRSPTPPRRRRLSPVGNRRSPSPIRRRRSPSPMRRQISPIVRRHRSPSPAHPRSPSPVRTSYRRSPRNRNASPVRRRSPFQSSRRSPPLRRRSLSPSDRSSSSPIRHDSPSPIRRTKLNQKTPLHSLHSLHQRTRSVENLSPAPQQSSGSEDSLQKESKNGNDYRKKVPALSPSPHKSPLNIEPPQDVTTAREKRSPVKRPKGKIARYSSSSPSRKRREEKLPHDSAKESEEEEDGNRPRSSERRSRYASRISKQNIYPAKISNKEENSPERVVAGQKFTESRSHLDNTESRNQEQEMKSGKFSGRGSSIPIVYKDSLPGEIQRAKADDTNRFQPKITKENEQYRKPGSFHSSAELVDNGNQSGGLDSGSEDSDKGRNVGKEKRENKRSEKEEVTPDDYSDDSAMEDKEAKKRRKEEKRLRKEKKRQKREERRRKKEKRRAEKQKVKNFSGASDSDGEHVTARGSQSSDNEDEAVQKKLEIELRKRALESLKAKKGISQ